MPPALQPRLERHWPQACGPGGQAQFGVDILGHDGRQSVGIQCKHYVSTKFTYATVTSDVAEADAANLTIRHLIFATIAPAKAEVVRAKPT